MKTFSKVVIASAALVGVIGTVGVVQARDGWRDGDYGCRGHGQFERMGPMGPGGFGHQGGPGGGQGLRMLERLDADGDGAVTQEEIDTVLAGSLAEFDASGDQSLTLDEFQGLWLDHMRERMVDHFQFHDADGDGLVTEAELDRPFSDLVSRMDRNGDGQLSLDDHPRRGAWSDDDADDDDYEVDDEDGDDEVN